MSIESCNSLAMFNFRCTKPEKPQYEVSSEIASIPEASVKPAQSRQPDAKGKSPKGKADAEEDDVEDSTMQVERQEIRWGEQVGEGQTARVYLGEWRGKPVAIKSMEPCRRNSVSGMKREIALLREVDVLGKVSHPNLVQFFGVSVETEPYLIITEFCFGGTLFEFLHECDLQPCIEQKVKMAGDIALSMNYLHSFKPMIIHRDLKSLNLLLAKRVKSQADVPLVKLTDFGFAKTKDEENWGGMTKNVGTFHWMAPEVGTGKYDQKADVYSYAMVLYEVLCEEIPFEEFDPGDVFKRVVGGERPDLEAVPPDCPDSIKKLMVQCWVHRPELRPPFSDICPVVDEVQKKLLASK